jgi:hypothetical protein
MKKLKFLVFTGMVLVMLGMTTCASFPKLDLSTLDPSQPVQVSGISLFIYTTYNADIFYGKYGDSLGKASEGLEEADKDKLLEILCGTAVKNWDFITERVKTKTGLMLDGDQLLEDWENRDFSRIHSQDLMPAGRSGYFYTWDNNLVEYSEEYSIAMIQLVFYGTRGSPSPELYGVIIETGDMDAFDEVTNRRQAKISLR